MDNNILDEEHFGLEYGPELEFVITFIISTMYSSKENVLPRSKFIAFNLFERIECNYLHLTRIDYKEAKIRYFQHGQTY